MIQVKRLPIIVYLLMGLLMGNVVSKIHDSRASLQLAIHSYLKELTGSEHTKRKRTVDLREFYQHQAKDSRSPALVAVTAHDVEQWVKNLHRRGLKPSSVDSKLSSVKSFFRNATETLGVPNPAARIKGPRVAQKGWQGITQLELSSLWSVLDGCTLWESKHDCLRNRALITLDYGAGLRNSESLDITEGQLSDDFSYIYDVRGKGERYDDIALSPAAVSTLQEYWEARAAELEQRDAVYARHGGRSYPVFLSFWYAKQGQPGTYKLSSKSHWRIAKEALLAAGVDPQRAHPHALRHAHGKRLCEIAGPRMAAESLRHAGMQHVMRYTNPTREELEEAKRKL